VEEIKGGGGITFAQDEASAKFSGMSQSAVHSGCVDVILPPEEIARELVRLGQHPYVASPQAAAGPAPVAEDQHFKKIVALLRSSLGVDFTHYRDTTVNRRIMRRMVLRMTPSLADYARLLEQDRSEIEALYEDLLINVTGFFREPETFEAQDQRVSRSRDGQGTVSAHQDLGARMLQRPGGVLHRDHGLRVS
jgi:two-component system CheB/CheR fusion protein